MMSHFPPQRASNILHQTASPVEIKTNNQRNVEERSCHLHRELMLPADVCAQRHADLQQYDPEDTFYPLQTFLRRGFWMKSLMNSK